MTMFTVFSSFLDSLFFVTASYAKKTSLPPSNAGIGNKFNMPILILKNAVNANIASNPWEDVLLTSVKIPIGPDKSDNPMSSLGLKSNPKVWYTCDTLFPIILKGYSNEYPKLNDVVAVIPNWKAIGS